MKKKRHPTTPVNHVTNVALLLVSVYRKYVLLPHIIFCEYIIMIICDYIHTTELDTKMLLQLISVPELIFSNCVFSIIRLVLRELIDDMRFNENFNTWKVAVDCVKRYGGSSHSQRIQRLKVVLPCFESKSCELAWNLEKSAIAANTTSLFLT